MLKPSELNAFARDFHEALAKAFPDIAARAVVDSGENVDRGSLLVKYAPDPARPKCELLISTHGGEVTVGFDRYHSHFDWPNDEPDEVHMHPLAFLAALVSDRLVVEVWTKGGKWAGSTTRDLGEAPDPSDHDGCDVVVHRSWSGKLDRESTPASARSAAHERRGQASS